LSWGGGVHNLREKCLTLVNARFVATHEMKINCSQTLPTNNNNNNNNINNNNKPCEEDICKWLKKCWKGLF